MVIRYSNWWFRHFKIVEQTIFICNNYINTLRFLTLEASGGVFIKLVRLSNVKLFDLEVCLYRPIISYFWVHNVILRKIISNLEVYFDSLKIIDLHQNCFYLYNTFYIHLLRNGDLENCDHFLVKCLNFLNYFLKACVRYFLSNFYFLGKW